MKLIKRVFTVLCFLFISVLMFGQVTTSSMSGKVTDSNGDPLVGTTVVATHVPSGTRYGALANNQGQYSIQGMRPGGPYTVSMSFVGYKTQSYTEITLALGENTTINSTLSPTTMEMATVTVIGYATSKFNTTQTGAVTNITNSQIANMPTISRSIIDVTRISPYGGNGMSFVGTDGRTANFTVDGANFNNNFGLSSALPGGGNPISIESIEELQVVIAPYDVRQTNFIGGGVNAITKSGTNTFKGSAYTYHRNENLRGDAVNGMQIAGARE